MKKTILVFGLIAGATVSAMLLVTTLLGKSNHANFDWGMVVGYASMLLAFSLIFIAVKSYRDRYNAGIISFKNAFWMGLGITVLASAIYVISWMLIYTFIYPDFASDYGQYTLAKMAAAGKTAAEIAQAKKEIAQAYSLYDTWYGLAGITFLEIFPVGLVVSLISALILKRKQSRLVTARIK